MDAQSVRTKEIRGVRGFDGHKRVKGRKRYLVVDTLGLPLANRVEPAGMSDRRGGARLVDGLSPLWPTIRTVIADGGHESRKLAAEIKRHEDWKLLIVKRGDRTFKIVGLNWIVARTFVWLGRSRRLARDYETNIASAVALSPRRQHPNAHPPPRKGLKPWASFRVKIQGAPLRRRGVCRRRRASRGRRRPSRRGRGRCRWPRSKRRPYARRPRSPPRRWRRSPTHHARRG